MVAGGRPTELKGSNEMTTAKRANRIGLILCLLPALYCFVTVVYALVKSAEYAHGTPLVIRYVVAPALIGLFFLCAAFFLSRETRLMVGIYATALWIGLFAFEAYVTIKVLPGRLGLVGVVGEDVSVAQYQQNLPPAFTIKHLNNVMEITDLEDAILAPIPGREMLMCSVYGDPVTYRPDRYGFRNPDSVYNDDIEVMLLGDSFVEGFCLDDGRDMASHLRTEIPQLVNTGHRGAGPMLELATLGRYGPELKPDLTVFAFFAGNDWRNLYREKEISWLTPVLDPGTKFGPAKHSPEQVEIASQVVQDWWKTTTLSYKDFLRKQRIIRNFFALQKTSEIIGIHYARATKPTPVYAQVLERAADIVTQWDGELVVVFIPPARRFQGLVSQDFIHDPLRVMVKEAADQAGLRLIDLTDAFEATDDPKSLFAADSHFNEEGAKLAASTIAKGLRNQGLMN